MPRPAVAIALALVVGCGDNGTRPESATAPPASAAAPTFARPGASAKPPPLAAPTPPAPAGPPASSEPVAVKEPPPDIEVTNIGMHIGGARNTEEEKSPLREAVRTHYDALRTCHAQGNGKDGTFGVDMRIGQDGGPARITNPRTAFGREVTACMVKVMEAVEFPKPPNGLPQTVSYSLRFRRKG